MEKVSIDFKLPEKEEIVYKETKIEIVPFLTIAQQIVLINRYVEDYFGKNEEPFIENSAYNHVEAEFNLMNRILQIATNIDVEKMDNDVYVDEEFINLIIKNIYNYEGFRKLLDRTIKEIKEKELLDFSLGKVLDELFGRLNGILDGFSKLSPEELEKAQKVGLELMEKLEKNPLLRNMSEEGDKGQ